MKISEHRVFMWEGRGMDSLDRTADKEEGGELGSGVLGNHLSTG